LKGEATPNKKNTLLLLSPFKLWKTAFPYTWVLYIKKGIYAKFNLFMPFYHVFGVIYSQISDKFKTLFSLNVSPLFV